jgi:tetratricopeptide (TPR) repeat protein
LRNVGRLEEAADRLRLNDHRFEAEPAWHLAYAVTLVLQDDRDGAIDRYRASLALRPDDPQTTVELAMLLLERRQGDDLDEAWELSSDAMRLAPRDPSVLVCRAELWALRGDIERAVALYRDAIQALPPDSPRRRAMEERARALGG